jgi:hypothetical protein
MSSSGTAAGTVGSAVQVGEGLGVELATVDETAETGDDVGPAPQPATRLERIAKSRMRASTSLT